MRKTIALVLVAAMMLMFIPMAFAATSLSAAENGYTYYDEDGIVPTKAANGGTVGGVTVSDNKLKGATVTKGGIAYISRPYDDFVNWQVPGNALTGNVATWNKWINIKVVINVDGAVKETPVYIEGAKYLTDGNGNFIYEFYCLPQAGGNTVSRTLALYDSSNKLMGYVTVSMVYSDVYKPSGYATTEGINQANTYASIDSDGVINVDVVYSNLVARMSSTNASNATYSSISYYPIRVRTQMTDKDGNLYPAFTRVDINKTSSSDLIVSLNEEVPNMPSWFYLTEDSEVWFEKRLGAQGTIATTLDTYKNTAKEYGGFNSAGTITEGWVNESVYGAAGSTVVGYAGLTSAVVNGQAFNARQFNSWTNDDLSLTANGVNEDAIRSILDFAIVEYYTDSSNKAVYGEYAIDTDIAVAAGNILNVTHPALSATTNQAEFAAFAKLLQGAYDKLTGADGSTAAKARLIGSSGAAGTWYGLTNNTSSFALIDVATVNWQDVPALALAAFKNIRAQLTAGYEISKLEMMVNLLTEDQSFALGFANVVNALADRSTTPVEKAAIAAMNAYRAEIQAALQNQLQYNANRFGTTTDEVELTLTKPNGEVSKLDVEIKYNAVSRIVAKALTTLDAAQKTITIVKGESVDVTVKAYQDQVPVTGQPIKFTSNDTNIATATSPNQQSTSNTNTTTITGVNVGTTTVRAYVQSSAYSSNALGTKVEAETFITVNVVDPTAETPAPTAPETTDFVCKVRKLWIRDGAGTSNSKLGYFSRNDIAKVIEVVNGWAKIEFNGGVAYASTGDGKYLSPK